MIAERKVAEGEYIIYCTETGIAVDVIKINEYNALSKPKATYRVDFRGNTKYSMLSLAEAKSKARKILKKELENR